MPAAKHSTPADGTFSPDGAIAWDADQPLEQSGAGILGKLTAGVGATLELTGPEVLSFAGAEPVGSAAAAVAAHEAAGDPHPQYSGGVSAVTGTAPIQSSGGAVPDISIDTFGASGAGHSRGAVPDPGASPGTAKFLREDATFAVPGSSSGTDEVLLVPTSNKQISANSSLVVADYYQLESGIQLLIESGANATIH